MTTKLKVYFDANIFIEVVKNKLNFPLTHSVTEVEYAHDLFQRHANGEIQISTSMLTLAEVVKTGNDPDGKSQKVKNEIHGLLASGTYCHLLATEYLTAIKARDLIWDGAGTKGADGIHLASAIRHGCAEFITFNTNDFQAKKARIEKHGIKCITPSESSALKATEDEEAAEPEPPVIASPQMDLLNRTSDAEEDEEKDLREEE